MTPRTRGGRFFGSRLITSSPPLFSIPVQRPPRPFWGRNVFRGRSVACVRQREVSPPNDASHHPCRNEPADPAFATAAVIVPTGPRAAARPSRMSRTTTRTLFPATSFDVVPPATSVLRICVPQNTKTANKACFVQMRRAAVRRLFLPFLP